MIIYFVRSKLLINNCSFPGLIDMNIQIILGSESDMPVAEKAKKILDGFDVNYNIIVASAHRTPEYLKEIIEKSNADVFIGVAGLSAALPGSIAAHTTKPVIGVPVSGKVNFDSILAPRRL